MAVIHDLVRTAEEAPASPPPPAGTGVPGAAAHLGVSTSTTRRLIAAGEIPAARVGSRVIVRYADLDRFLADRAAVAADQFGEGLADV